MSIAEASPRFLARMAGVFQALEGTAATYGQVIVFGGFVVAGNASATVANILGHERLFWLGFAFCIVGVVFHIAWALLLYELFKPVNRRLSLFAMFVMLVGCAIQALTSILYLAPMIVLTGGASSSAFTAEQLHSLAFTFVRLNGYSFNTYLVFFGLWCFVIGCLIFRSIFIPRVLGVLLAIAGVGWMIYISPHLGIRLFPFIATASALGEIPVMLWLIVMGVNSERWKEQASAAGMRA